MRPQVLSSALALVGSSMAFTDSSPWVLLSTSEFGINTAGKAISLASDALQDTKTLLKGCPTNNYLLVNQRGMTTADFRRTTTDTSVLPSLSRAAEDTRVKGRFLVTEVVGEMDDMGSLENTGLPGYIRTECASQNKQYDVDILDLASLPSEHLDDALAHNDALILNRIASATADSSYTILFLSTPEEPSLETSSRHAEYKRHMQAPVARRDDNSTEWNKLPLFEKYQFFTPALFMGIIVSIVLISILGVGIRALTSLEVSYGAFEKENGPSAHKKQ